MTRGIARRSFGTRLAAAMIALGVLWPTATTAWTSDDGTFEIHGYTESVLYWREERGLAKWRNTAQLELNKRFGEIYFFDDVEIVSILRGTYDGVYDLNDNEFGHEAGGARNFRSRGDPNAGVPSFFTPWGQSPISTGTLGFGFDLAQNPNQNLEVLGEHLHNPGGGVTFGVPVRPCDDDNRGCIDNYMGDSTNDLRFPEFDTEHYDWIREAYARASIKLDNGRAFDFSIGRQQVVWGRTDLFRVLDVVNPVDFARHNIYDELEDIRIPMAIFTAEFRAGAFQIFEDLNFQFLWKFEEFRPHNLGQAGTPYQILDAGSLFRGLKTCWDLGCTVSNFGAPPPNGSTQPGILATDFPSHTIGIRSIKMPNWKFKNTDIGGRIEGVVHGIGFSANILYYYSHLPSLRGGIASRNPFVPDGVPCSAISPFCQFPNEIGGQLIRRDFLPAFDVRFPRLLMIGGSADIYNDWVKTAFRLELAWTKDEEFANTTRPESFSESDVIRWVVGADRPTFIRFLNPRRSFLFSWQLFGQHLLDFERKSGLLGRTGIPDWEHNLISTLLIRGSYFGDRVNPQLISAWDTKAQTAAIAPSLDWLISDHWRLIVGANFKVGKGARKFDDTRTANPFPNFTCPPPDLTCTVPSASLGLDGFEPLGRFRAGPIGMARDETEFEISLRYRF